MASVDAAMSPRRRLVEALRASLDSQPGMDPADAERLGCLLTARAGFEAVLGAPPGGDLATLPPPFAGFEVPGEARAAIDDLRPMKGGLEAAPSALGDGYEQTIAADDRNARGQYYTPRPVAEALVGWALDGDQPSDQVARVLDPAVGTGTFLLAAVQSLRDRYPDRPPTAFLDRLIGIDVDAVALQLAGLRLAAAAEVSAPNGLALSHRSFFDSAPVGAGADQSAQTVQPVDAVVGNPPFVRAEALAPDVEHFRRHLTAFGDPGATPLLDGDAALSRRSDAYVYFVTHATRFLRPGGRLALVLPTKWLMSAYGEDLRRFLRERYRVHAVVGFDGRAFGDVLVDTALLFAERDPDAASADSLRFITAADPTDAEGLLAAVEDRSIGVPSVERQQRSLTASGSLARYLEAPAELLALLDGPPFVRLDALAEVSRGTMTGANRFFFVDAATVDRFEVDPRFLRPAVKSLRSVDQPVVEPADVERWLVDVHPFVDQNDGSAGDAASEAAVKAALSSRGFDGLRRYVEQAEREGWHEGRTCQSRAVWFDLGPLRAPAAFVPKLVRERVFTIRNAADAVPSNAIDGVWPAEEVHTGALLAVLNASAGKAAMEVTGRDEAGLLQLMTYETASLPILDVRQLTGPTAAAIAEAGTTYAANPGDETIAALDRAVDEAFDLSMSPARLREQAADLRRQRIDGGEPASGSSG